MLGEDGGGFLPFEDDHSFSSGSTDSDTSLVQSFTENIEEMDER
jgi:hypothetical protein